MISPDRSGLRGVWAAIPVPWASPTAVDRDQMAEMVRRYRDAGLAGSYTTGTDGELHVLELDLYEQVAAAFADAVSAAALPAQMGVSWVNMRGVLERARVAHDLGFRTLQTALPFWETLSAAETMAFFAGLADAEPDALFVHYNIAKVGRLLAGADYAALVDAVPALVGTKLTGGDVDLTIDCLLLAPTLRHFVVDGHMMPAAMFGASGIYSAIANLNPRWAAEWWAAAEAGDWAEVARRRLLLAQFRTHWRAILAGVTSSPAIGHVFARCGVLPEISLAVQPPYQAASVEQAAAVAAVVRSRFPELVYRG